MLTQPFLKNIKYVQTYIYIKVKIRFYKNSIFKMFLIREGQKWFYTYLQNLKIFLMVKNFCIICTLIKITRNSNRSRIYEIFCIRSWNFCECGFIYRKLSIVKLLQFWSKCQFLKKHISWREKDNIYEKTLKFLSWSVLLMSDLFMITPIFCFPGIFAPCFCIC